MKVIKKHHGQVHINQFFHVVHVKHFPQENSRTFCSVLLRGTFSTGLLSGIISALLSALSWMLGLFSLIACSPSWVTFLQKSTLTSSRLSPWATTPSCRLQSVMRTQFSRCRRHSFLQLCSTEITSWSVMCPQPDRVSWSRLGHLCAHTMVVTLRTNYRFAHTWWWSTSAGPVFSHPYSSLLRLCYTAEWVCLDKD